MTSELRPFSGPLTRETPVLELDAGTWKAMAKVTPITGGRGEQTAHRRFEVSVAWTGPPMHGFARGPDVVDATDLLMVDELELAKAIAMAAIDSIRAHKVPDLRALERKMKAR